MLPLVMVLQAILFVCGGHWKKLEQFIFTAKKRFFTSDISIIGYSVFPIIFLVGSYELLRIIGTRFPLFPDIEREIFYPFVFTFLGFGISLMLALRLITKQIETGEEFLMHLIEHISSIEQKQLDKEINIITPNINIGTGVTTHKTKKGSKVVPFSEIIKNNQHITFSFICMTIDKEYINTYTTIEDAQKINFFQNGKNNNSAMLEYLHNRYYDKNIATLDKIITELKAILDCNNVVIKPCKKDFTQHPVIGYISKKECVLAKFSDIQSQKGNVRIKGERIMSQEFINIVEQHLLTEFICTKNAVTN
jgi:hypothetical protein